MFMWIGLFGLFGVIGLYFLGGYIVYTRYLSAMLDDLCGKYGEDLTSEALDLLQNCTWEETLEKYVFWPFTVEKNVVELHNELTTICCELLEKKN